MTENPQARLIRAFHDRTGRCVGSSMNHLDCARIEQRHGEGNHSECLPVEDEPLGEATLNALMNPTETEQRRRAAQAERDKPKVLVRREILLDAALDSVSLTMAPNEMDLDPDQTIEQWIAREKTHGTARDYANDCDLLFPITLYFQVIEHYDDGTHKCVERAEWEDEK